MSPMERSVAPHIAGRDSRKEKRAALAPSIPRNRRAAIVDPDRDIPGAIARDCATPVIIASVKVMLSRGVCHGASAALQTTGCR